MSKIVYTGIESSGKSLMLAKQAKSVLARNIKWYKITGTPRTMAFNTPMHPHFIAFMKKHGIPYVYFRNLQDILGMTECDIFLDELIKFFPSNGSNPLSREQVDFVTQGAKSGVHIYSASQDFSQVHKQFRLLVNEVYIIRKIIGSRRPMKTAPPVKTIWGLCSSTSVSPRSFKGDTATMEAHSVFPSFFFIRKEDTMIFDTSHKIALSTLPDKYVRKQRLIGLDEEGKEVYKKEIWL